MNDKVPCHAGRRASACFAGSERLSQGDIENRTGFLRWYVSRVENDHTTPAIETVEKWATAPKIPLYAIFYEGKRPVKPVTVPKALQLFKSLGDARFMKKLARSLSRTQEQDRRLLLQTALKLASRKKAHNCPLGRTARVFGAIQHAPLVAG